MGFCSCGLPVDTGEYVLLRPGGAIHVGCPERTAATGPTTQTEASGFLFDDGERAIVEKAKETIGVNHIRFDGASVLGIDTPRLAGQLARVFELMRDGQYRTLTQIASATECLETSASARLRDFRKPKFGSHSVIQRQVEGSALLYEYRLIVNEKKETDGRRYAA